MGNKILRLFLIVGVIVLFAFADSFAGAPPGATSSGGGYATQSAAGTSISRAFHIDLGMYSPSLSMLNEDLKYYGYSSISRGTYFNLGFNVGDSRIPGQKTLLSFAYWSGTSSNSNFNESLRLYMFHISPQWELTGLSDAILPSKDLRIGLGFVVRDVVASVIDEYHNTNSYVAFIGMAIDLGPTLGVEYYPIRNSRNFSVSANLDYILLNWNFLPLNVSDYSSSLSGLVKIGDNYKNHKGQDMLVETNGLTLRFGVNFYY